MPARLSGKLADLEARVFSQSSRDRANPARRFTLGLPAGALEESLQGCAKAARGGFFFARASEEARLPSDPASDPQHDGHRWKQRASEPGRIELNLDLFKAHGRDRVAMGCAGTIEDCGRTGDELLPDFSLVQIRAHHKERENGPVVGVLRHAGVAAVDDPCDRGSAEALRHEILSPSTMVWCSYLSVARRAVK